jgi:hypothetical protein
MADWRVFWTFALKNGNGRAFPTALTPLRSTLSAYLKRRTAVVEIGCPGKLPIVAGRGKIESRPGGALHSMTLSVGGRS